MPVASLALIAYKPPTSPLSLKPLSKLALMKEAKKRQAHKSQLKSSKFAFVEPEKQYPNVPAHTPMQLPTTPIRPMEYVDVPPTDRPLPASPEKIAVVRVGRLKRSSEDSNDEGSAFSILLSKAAKSTPENSPASSIKAVVARADFEAWFDPSASKSNDNSNDNKI
jgi:hypothetical protein